MPHYFDELTALLAYLRQRCPWDKKQTHQTLKPYLLEESYELLAAIDSGDPAHAKDELGDVLLQVLFHAQLYHETGDFDIEAVVRHLSAKLVHRHRPLFSDDYTGALSDEMARQAWDDAKSEEGKKSTTGKAGSALMKADHAGKQAAAIGFDFADWRQALAKVQEELGELAQALENDERQAAKEELGDCFFALTNLARQLQLDSELVALQAVHKFQRRFDYVQRHAPDGDKDTETLEALWQQAKR